VLPVLCKSSGFIKKYIKKQSCRKVKKEISSENFQKSTCLLLLPFFFQSSCHSGCFSLQTIQMYFSVNQYKNESLYLSNLHNIIVHIDVTNVKNLTGCSCQSFNILSFCVFCIKTSVYFVQNQSL